MGTIKVTGYRHECEKGSLSGSRLKSGVIVWKMDDSNRPIFYCPFCGAELPREWQP